MASGLNENIDILGRVLHVQTEMTQGDEPRVRTTVYDGGRIVATRESALEDGLGDDDEVLHRIRHQHELIIENMIKRSEQLAARKRRMIEEGPEAPRSVEPRTQSTRANHGLPDASDPLVQKSLSCRRLVGPFSLALSSAAAGDPSSGDLLEVAVSWIGEITASPVFPELRLDEQVRFLDLRDRFGAWRSGGLGPEASSELLWDTVAFADQLLEINQRRDLAAYDHKLLLWALAEIGSQGMTEEIMTRLESQRGRDKVLDTVLDHPDLAEPDRLPEILMSLIDRTLPD